MRAPSCAAFTRSGSVGRPRCSRKAAIGWSSAPVAMRTLRSRAAHASLVATTPGDHVAVAAQELRRAVQHERGPELERALQHRRHEGRVDEHGHAARVAHRLRDVDEVERRVARRLEHHEAGVGPHRALHPGGRRERHLVAEQAAGEQRVAAAVERPHRDHVVLPGLARGEEHRRERRHAGRERDRGLGALERGERAPRSGRRSGCGSGRRRSCRSARRPCRASRSRRSPSARSPVG